jgi:hypothetical protein
MDKGPTTDQVAASESLFQRIKAESGAQINLQNVHLGGFNEDILLSF